MCGISTSHQLKNNKTENYVRKSSEQKTQRQNEVENWVNTGRIGINNWQVFTSYRIKMSHLGTFFLCNGAALNVIFLTHSCGIKCKFYDKT